MNPVPSRLDLTPFISLFFRDPDGMEGEVLIAKGDIGGEAS